MNIKEILSIRLRNLLDEKQMSQSELSKKSTVTEATISNFLNCKQLPKLEVVSKIADVLGVSVDFLLGRTDIPKNNIDLSKYKHLNNPLMNRLSGRMEMMSDNELKKLDKLLDIVINEEDK